MIIREAKPDDAQQLIAYVQWLSEEPGSNILLSPGEFTLTIAEEEQVLSDYARSDNAVYLVADFNGKIIGSLSCKGSARQATRHVVTLGMSVDQAWRRQGIGSKLLEAAIQWAKVTSVVSRIELDVFERNDAAIRLYQKYGFEVEGRRRKAIYRDGRFLDDLIMALVW